MLKDNPQLEVATSKTLKLELENRRKELSEILLSDLQIPTIKSSQSRFLISYLQRLGMPDKVSSLIRKLTFAGKGSLFGSKEQENRERNQVGSIPISLKTQNNGT